MALMYDSVLAGALAAELDGRWSGRRLEALRFDGERRALLIDFRDEQWVWLLHPATGVLATVAAGNVDPRSRDRGLLDGPLDVESVRAPADTRRVEIGLVGPGGAGALLGVHLVTNRWNAAFVAGGIVRRLLVPGASWRGIEAGKPWAPPVSERRWRDRPPSLEAWLRDVEPLGAGSRRSHLAWLSRANEDWVFGASGPDERHSRYLTVREAASGTNGGWLRYRTSRGALPYPHALGDVEAPCYPSLMAAIEAWAESQPGLREALESVSEPGALQELRQALRNRHSRAVKKRRALEVQLEAGSEAEAQRAIGHLLLARKADVPVGAEEVSLTDFDGSPVVVELDPRLDAPANARRYYDMARKSDRAASALPEKIARVQRRIDRLEAVIDRLDGVPGPEDEAWRLAGLPPGGRARRSGKPVLRTQERRLPYRRYRTSGGLEVRAGRSASDNDDLTFRHASPDDIWMHVRESPGSHVVLRWGRKDQNPSERDLAEAAMVAAVLSRARGSRLVPVSWTRRKYVRKPRKAGPGKVTTERTQTIFVEPDAKRVEELAEEED